MSDEHPPPVVAIIDSGLGLGARIADRFERAGATVALGARAREMIPGDRLRRWRYDPGSPGAEEELVAAIVATLGRIDVWVTIVPTLEARDAELITGAEWNAGQAAVVGTTFRAAQAAGRAMLAHGRGVIVNVVSTQAYKPVGGQSARSVSEAAVVMLTEALGVEWAGRGIRVVGVAAGDIANPTRKRADGRRDEGGETRNRVPLRRSVTPDDVAEAVAFIASDAASYIVAETIRVDGGWTAHQLF